jgi:pyruvate dehydrogenase E1 component alpha subunit
VIFFGEAATEEGVFHESMNFAALWRLPVVFVCENNLYSVYSPLTVRQPRGRDNVLIARGYGMESYRVDGMDVLAVYDLCRQAVERAREGGGPTFLELSTYRWREHCGPNYDNHLGYRTEHEFLQWKARDPIKAFEARLRRDGLLDDAEVADLARRIDAEIDDAVAFAKDSPWPEPELLMEHVYA